MHSEPAIQQFWDTHPCGEYVVDSQFAHEARSFFDDYDAYRYRVEGHILKCLDAIDWRGKEVLEIGLGQGADSEQLIRRGARWSGLDLTPEAVARVRTRLQLRQLPFGDIRQGSVLEPPYSAASFDMIYSHGVLHHVPEIQRASVQIARLLRPGGELVIMMYARWSLHYLLAIAGAARVTQTGAYLMGRYDGPTLRGGYVGAIRKYGLLRYLRMKNFIHHNTDGPACPYSGVYDLRRIRRDFPEFRVVKAYKCYMPVLRRAGNFKLPGSERLLGFNLWVHLRHK